MPPMHARLALTLAFLVLLLLGAPVVSVADCGDVDGDQVVSATDALTVLAGTVGLDETCNGNCDCDLDCTRSISATDALFVLRWAVFGEAGGCCTGDYCFNDEDCDLGFYCGNSILWCDAVCLPEAQQ